MSPEDAVKDRIKGLINQARGLSAGSEHGQVTSHKQAQECSAWIASAQNAVHLIFDTADAPYRQRIDRIAATNHGWVINDAVGEASSILENLLADAERGLLASVADRVRAETFDDFLDHAVSYLKENRKNEAGVIGGVVFEDTLRQICRKEGLEEKDVKLDELISELTKRGVLSPLKAKRARVAAHVRTKASHAQWDEFQEGDVQATIEFTRELIESKLDG